MRRTYMSPEYKSNRVYGSFSMVENSTIQGSKMLEIDDSINIEDTDIIWYQNDYKEQIDFSTESSLNSYFYSSVDSKMRKHLLYIDDKQDDFQKERNTKWVLEIDIKEILSNYIFASLKKYRTFEGLRNEMCLNKDVDIAIDTYISNNILSRYKLSKIDLYVEYKELRTSNNLRYENVYNNNIPKDSLLEKYNMEFGNNKSYIDGSNIKIYFEQRPSSLYNFEYYFDIYFIKI